MHTPSPASDDAAPPRVAASPHSRAAAEAPPELLNVTRADRRLLRMPWTPLIRNKFHEFWIKARGKRIKGQGLIGADSWSVATGFESLSPRDFETYNLPQNWVERRTIPRALNRRVPAHNARVIDLGCGPGFSTRIIAHFAQPSWNILGFDFVAHYIAEASRHAAAGTIRNRDNLIIRPTFRVQSITETLATDSGPLEASSIDFAVAGGVVGLYLQPPDVATLALELCRVIKPGGYAALDSGPAIPPHRLKHIMLDRGFAFVELIRSVAFDPRPKLVFMRLPHAT
ncbi:MAG: class I SAM-dependent methyltransferase [Planctomycetota bacterium]|nr:class I SAM-dependent methyltransferase [Planctomycetota bacterium]